VALVLRISTVTEIIGLVSSAAKGSRFGLLFIPSIQKLRDIPQKSEMERVYRNRLQSSQLALVVQARTHKILVFVHLYTGVSCRLSPMLKSSYLLSLLQMRLLGLLADAHRRRTGLPSAQSHKWSNKAEKQLNQEKGL